MIPDSSAQQSFLRKHKKRQQFIRLMRLAVFLVFLLLWEVSARLGFIDSFILDVYKRQERNWQVFQTL